MRVKRLQRLLLLADFRLDLPHAFAIAMRFALTQKAVQFFNPGFAFKDFLLQIGDFSEGKATLFRLRLLSRFRLAALRPRRSRTLFVGLVGGRPGREAAAEEELIGVVVTLDNAKAIGFDYQEVIGHSVDKVAVVADEEHGPVELAQERSSASRAHRSR